MALTRFIFPTCLILLALLLIEVSADYGYAPKPPQAQKPETPQLQKPNPPHVEKPKLDQLLPHNLFGIQGLVLCNSGPKAFPIQGAVARITCVGEDENGYETAPFSMLTGATDAKGYFFATLSPSKVEENRDNKKWKLTECKAFLNYSPLESCKVPTDINHGISGAPVASCRTLNANNLKLFSVGPFFYTCEPKPSPNGY